MASARRSGDAQLRIAPGDRAAGDGHVIYHLSNRSPSLAGSSRYPVVKPAPFQWGLPFKEQRADVPLQYADGVDVEGPSGGWEASTVDLARVFASFDRREPDNRLMSLDQAWRMWNPDPVVENWASGWAVGIVEDHTGTARQLRRWNGAWPGTMAGVQRVGDMGLPPGLPVAPWYTIPLDGLTLVVCANLRLPGWGHDWRGDAPSNNGVLNELYRVAGRISAADAWPAGDLIDTFGFPPWQ